MWCSPLRKLSMLDPGQRSHQFSNYDNNLLISGGNIFLRSPEKFSNVSRIFSFASPLWCLPLFFPTLSFYFSLLSWEGPFTLGTGFYSYLFQYLHYILLWVLWYASVVYAAVFGALEHEWEQDNDSASPWGSNCCFGCINCYRVGCFC